jgi:hypothetical protein
MKLRVLMGAVLAGLLLFGAGEALVQADPGATPAPGASLDAVEILSATHESDTEFAVSGEQSSSHQDADPDNDNDNDPVIKVRYSGLPLLLGPMQGPAAQQAVQCLMERPPAPPPKSRGAETDHSTDCPRLGLERPEATPSRHRSRYSGRPNSLPRQFDLFRRPKGANPGRSRRRAESGAELSRRIFGRAHAFH